MITLGINNKHSNASACVVIDGAVKFAIEEERLIRVKNYNGFPIHSINACLDYIKKTRGNSEYDNIAVNFNPFFNLPYKINKFLLLFYKNYILTIKNLFEKIFIKEFNYFNLKKKKIIYINHHLSHISSSFYNSNFDNAIGLTIDGFGDNMSLGIYSFDHNKIKLLHKICFPESLGIFYQSITQYLGFRDYGDEYKVMGLAAFGKKYLSKEMDTLIKYDGKFNFKLNLNFFNKKTFGTQVTTVGYPYFKNLFNEKKFSTLFKRKKVDSKKITDFHKNIAYSAQKKFSEIVLGIISSLKKEYNNYNNLCLSGGCFFNSDTVGQIIEKKIFPKIYIYPNPGDGGGSTGAALYVNNKSKNSQINKNIFIGPSFSNKEVIRDYLKFKKQFNYSYDVNYFKSYNELYSFVANKISKGKIVAWFQDEMEWGQRALGNRSILADPRKKEIIKKINIKIKKREEFRPFAGSVLANYKKDFFNIDEDSPFMMGVYKINKNKKNKILGISHVNNTCRIQTVLFKDNKKFYNLINAFYKITNIPILLNTSFNIDEPIVCSPYDALKTFYKSDLDYLVVQNYVFTKK